ncbi:hypothetical protein TNCV_628341 [Trichonephila clavipes]|nr:hypothetical protein TNCV_628341 [Trichonephila clavipes]
MASASSGPSGIKRKALSISDKLNILKKYDEGCKANKKQKEIAEELGIAPSTLRTVLKSRELILRKTSVEPNDKN